MKYNRILIKISGEALLDNKQHCIFDFRTLKKVSEIVKKIKKNICCEIAIVVGGGNIYRGKQSNYFDQITGDHIGMIATVINAFALKKSFEKENLICHVLSNVEIKNISDFYTSDKAKQYLKNGEIVIFAGGTGNTCFTTDTAAILKAIEINAEAIFMIKNGVDGVYNDDPLKNKNAKLIDKISFQEIIDKKINVMDLTAITLLMSSNKNIKIHVFSFEYENFIKLINNEKIGTLIQKK